MSELKIIINKSINDSDEIKITYSDGPVTKEYFLPKGLNVTDFVSTKDFLSKELSDMFEAKITAEGSCVIVKGSPGLDLSISTYGNVSNGCNLELGKLNIIANGINLNHQVIANKLNFKAKEVINDSILCSRGKLLYQGNAIVNNKAILADYAHFTITKDLKSSNRLLFNNKGVLAIGGDLLLASEKISVNSGEILVGGEADFKLSALNNSGRISSYGKSYIDAKAFIVNKKQGCISSKERLRLSFRSKNGQLINFGTIAGDRTAIRNCYDFVNDLDATIITRELELLVGSIFFNAGKICGKEKCALALLTSKEANAINTSNGEIISDHKIDLVVKDNLINYGKISGVQIGLKGKFFGSLFNLDGGNISSEALLNLKAMGELVNSSTIQGMQTDISAEIIDNQARSCIIGKESLQINGKLIQNAGVFGSDKQVVIDVQSLLRNLETGIIEAVEETLTIYSGLLIRNSGLFKANKLDCKAIDGLFTNATKGSIECKDADLIIPSITNRGNIKTTHLHTESKSLFNSGVIESKVLTSKVQGIFRNLQEGVIKVDALAKIMTKNNFDNFGKLFSNQKIEIIGKEVYNYADSKLQTEHLLYIKAVNLFANGEIQSGGNLILLIKENFEYETATLKADGELSLTLADGSLLVHKINTPGDLHIEFLTKEGVWHNEQKLIAGGDITIDVPGYVFINGQTSKEGLIHAGRTLSIRAKQIEVQQGSLQAAKLDLRTKYHIIVKPDGTLIGINGVLESLEGNIEQHGKIEFLKHLAIMAKKVYQDQGSATRIEEGDLEITAGEWILKGFTDVAGELKAKVTKFHLEQCANTLQVPVTYNATMGKVMVSIQQPDPQTGVLQAKKIAISCETFTQFGGIIKSGPGGTYLEIKGDAYLEGLRATHIWQGAISARGRNYAIVPTFVPAKIESEGDLQVNLDGKLVGASIELKALGVKQVTAKQGVTITEKHEAYAPPEFIPDDDDDDWFDGIFSIVAGAFVSCLLGPIGLSFMSTSAAAITSAAAGAATTTALNGGKAKDIFKSAAIAGITAGIANKLKFSTVANSSRTVGQTAATTAVSQASAAANQTVVTTTASQAINKTAALAATKASENALRIANAVNSMMKPVINAGVSKVISGHSGLNCSGILGAGVAGFSGAAIPSEFGKKVTEVVTTSVASVAHGSDFVRSLVESTAGAVGSSLGTIVGNKVSDNIAMSIGEQGQNKSTSGNSSSSSSGSSSSSSSGPAGYKLSLSSIPDSLYSDNKIDSSSVPGRSELRSLPTKITVQDHQTIAKQGLIISEAKQQQQQQLKSNEQADYNISKEQTRTKFKLLSQFSEHSSNPILEHAYAVGRGIEIARDTVTDLVLHPIENLKELSVMSWDGYNAISGLLFGYSTAESRARNIMRGSDVLDTIDYIKQASSSERLEMGTALIASGIFGTAVTRATGPLIKNVLDCSYNTKTWMYHSIKYQGITRKIDPSLIKFSQSSVNAAAELTESMQQYGWKPIEPPIDIVKMEDGKLITLDNTRVLAAHNSGIKVKGIIRDATDPLPKKFIELERFATKKDGNPKTWGEAVKFRINNQNKKFKETYPNGSNIVGVSNKP